MEISSGTEEGVGGFRSEDQSVMFLLVITTTAVDESDGVLRVL